MSRVGIIIPVIETEPIKNIIGLCRSIENQSFDPSRIVAMFVYRHADELGDVELPLLEKAEQHITDFIRPSSDPRSQMEQCEVGINAMLKIYPDVEHLVVAAAGDELHHDFVKDLRFALTADDRAHVSIPDLAFCDQDMLNPEVVKSSERFSLGVMVQCNIVPDCSMFRRDLIDHVPFTSEHGRSSFWIWWLQIFRKLDFEAFVNVHKPLYNYRFHEKTASSFDDEWVNEGYRRFSEWAISEGLIPPGKSIKPFPKSVWHPKVRGRKINLDNVNGNSLP